MIESSVSIAKLKERLASCAEQNSAFVWDFPVLPTDVSYDKPNLQPESSCLDGTEIVGQKKENKRNLKKEMKKLKPLQKIQNESSQSTDYVQ